MIEYNDDGVDVFILTGPEWDAALTRSLADLGLTMEELRQQAETNDFTSEAARHLWFFAGPT